MTFIMHEHQFANKPPVQRSLVNLFGLLETGESPPSDDECDNILKDELLRKYSNNNHLRAVDLPNRSL